MAEKKFSGLGGPLQGAEIQADYDSAEQIDKIRVGKTGVFFRDGLKTRFLAYPEIERAFIRVQETRSRMCCGQANFNYFRLVFVNGGKEIANVMSEDEKETDRALAAIAARGVATGFIKA